MVILATATVLGCWVGIKSKIVAYTGFFFYQNLHMYKIGIQQPSREFFLVVFGYKEYCLAQILHQQTLKLFTLVDRRYTHKSPSIILILFGNVG